MAAHAAPAPVSHATFKAEANGVAQVQLAAKSPVVFEIGKLGIPWRRVSEVGYKDQTARWRVKAGRTYEAWDAAAYAAAQVQEAGKAVGHAFASSGAPLRNTLAALRWMKSNQAKIKSEEADAAKMRLEIALAALLKIRVSVEAGARQQLWPQYTLPIKGTFACETAGVRAALSSISIPDNWTVVSREPAKGRSAPGKARVSTLQVRVPNHAVFYPGNYPITAWYDVEYDGLKFKAFNAVEANIVPIFERVAWLTTVSDTQVDLRIRLTSLMPIRNVTTEPYAPSGWTSKTATTSFGVSNTKEIVYHITRPANEKRGLRIVGGTFHVGDYTTSKRVITDHSLTLGQSRSTTGFEMLRVPGEEAAVVTQSDRQCRRIPASGKMYFDVSENFPPGETTHLTLTCAAEQPCEVWVEYRTVDGKTVSTDHQKVDPASPWRDVPVVIKNAVFDGGLANKADFVVRSDGALCVGGVYISRFGSP